ncbi:MAG: glycosyltransferase family 4 protein [Nitrosomonadales bacterium]|nr:glycosyltransferase family 4 protein [Nitrosomonadales bacterium]
MSKARSHQVLINCSNLHVGGGVAVATSFIDCLAELKYEDTDIHLLLSSDVSRNLKMLGTDTNRFASCQVRDFFGIKALWQGLSSHFRGMDLVFTVFGPAYFLFSKSYHLVGFAQPLIIYPDNPITARLNFFNHMVFRIKYRIQQYFFTRADAIIVELEHVKTGLEKIDWFAHKPISVVHSAVHTVFKEPDKWLPLVLPKSQASLKLGIISRNYPHKNLQILGEVKRHLLEDYKLAVDFYVTFQPDEWASCDASFRGNIINVGGLNLSQCPTFYSLMDGVIFPSLLECFSAVPIEAMMVKKPLFASDLPFIRDVCDDHCNYFDPLDAKDIARVIFDFFKQPESERAGWVGGAYEHVQKYHGPVDRAEKYMAIIKELVSSHREIQLRNLME